MKRTRILAIAPYEGLREILLEAAIGWDNITLDVYLGDLQEGVAVARALEDANYDVILSRGGTATMIREAVSMPVIDITPSASDLLRYVRMAENIPGRFAVVGYRSITHTAEQLLSLVNKDIRIFTLENQPQAEEAVKTLMAEGYTMLVGDAIAVNTAKKHRLNSILVASGRESVQEALLEAVEISQLVQGIQKQNTLYKKILEHSGLSIVVCDERCRVLFSNLSKDHLEFQRVFRPLPDYVPNALNEGDFRLMRRSRGFLFEVTARIIKQEHTRHVVFFVRQLALNYHLSGGVVEYYHLMDANQASRFQHPIDNIGIMAGVQESARAYSKTRSNLVLIGEAGAPFDSVILTAHQESTLRTSPLVVIDCALMDGKSFAWVMENENSPLYETNLTICLKSFSSLSESLQEQFVRHTECAFLPLHNRLVFCVDAPIHEQEKAFRLLGRMDSCTLPLPSLRDRIRDIPGLASLYLSSLNIEYGKQVLGFEDTAQHLLMGYDWPGNNAQLYRFVKQCLLKTNTTLVTATQVLDGIASERMAFSTPAHSKSVLSGRLHEINQQIALAVLKEENMNRQKTAERLGISRSTLWRMLKDSLAPD